MTVGLDVQRLINNARVRLPGATDDAIQYALFATMDNFFKGSNTWLQDIDLEIPGGDPAGTVYQLVPDNGALIDKLMWVFQKSTSPNFVRGAGVSCAMSTPGELTLTTQPSSDVVYTATVALTVEDPTTRDGYVQFPAWVLAKYREVILDGLVGSMMSQPSKPFTNTTLSVFHMRKFNNKIASARVEMMRNNKFRQQAWAFPSFNRGRQRGGTGWGGPV